MKNKFHKSLGNVKSFSYVYYVIKRETMMITVRELRRWLFDFEYLNCVINGEELDNSRSRRVLYEWVDQETYIEVQRIGNTYYLTLQL